MVPISINNLRRGSIFSKSSVPIRCCCLLAQAEAQNTIHASTGLSSQIVSFSIISTPESASALIAVSHFDNISLSTEENPIVGDHIAVLGNSSVKLPSQSKFSPSKEKISVGCGPTVASSARALSSVVFAIGPFTVRSPEPGGVSPPIGILPCEVLIPASPPRAAGILIEPPPSEPVPRGIIPDASAADVPPEDPPGEYSRFQGFLVIPKGTLSVFPLCPNSGVLVFPKITQP